MEIKRRKSYVVVMGWLFPAAYLLLAACATAPAVLVASETPAECEYLGEVSDSAYWELREEAAERLQKHVAALGGNLLVCCSASDTLVLNKFQGRQYAGRAYRCPVARDRR